MRILFLFALALAQAFSQSGGHYNIVARDTMSPGGHGLITMNNEGQVVSALQLDITKGPLNITKVVVHFDNRKLKPWPSPVSPRTTPEWTSRPIKWPSGRAHKVTAVEYWYTGKTGAKPEIAVLGLQK
jgi:hypothetical protein